jgi:hypothetical protein
MRPISSLWPSPARNLIAFTFSLVVAASAGHAHADESRAFILGLSATHLRSSVQGVEATNGADVETSAENGGALRYRVIRAVGTRVSVESGVGYATRGGLATTEISDPDAPNVVVTERNTLRQHFVEVPLLVRFQVWRPRSDLELDLFAGPSLSIVVKSDTEREVVEVDRDTGENEFRSESIDLGDRTSTLAARVSAGFEFTKLFEDWRAGVFAGFEAGLGNWIQEAGNSEPVGLEGGKVRGLVLGFAISVRL